MRWLVLCVVAGCYAPTDYRSCATTCTADLACPPGLVCVGSVCRASASEVCSAMPSDAPGEATSNDRDGDTIPDVMDLCPDLASPDNRDHDGDQRGDPCDPCPHLAADAADLDGDGDGVGNGCDPRPTVPGDTRAAFYGFYDAGDIAGWAAIGTWTVTGGKLHGDNLALGGSVIEAPPTQNMNVTITAAVTILAANSQTTLDHYAGVTARRTAANNYQACHLRSLNGVREVRYRTVTNGTLADVSVATAASEVGAHLVKMAVLGSTVSCSVDTMTLTTGAFQVPGRVGVEAGLVQSDVDYLFVVASP